MSVGVDGLPLVLLSIWSFLMMCLSTLQNVGNLLVLILIGRDG